MNALTNEEIPYLYSINKKKNYGIIERRRKSGH